MNEQEFNEAVQKAIQAEIEAANFYRSLQKFVKNEDAKIMLRELENMEWGHKHMLEHLNTDGIENYESAKIPDLKIANSLINPVDFSHMSIQDVITAAIKKEEEAWKTYLQLSEEYSDARIKKLFARLADEEKKHKFQLESLYDDKILYEN